MPRRIPAPLEQPNLKSDWSYLVDIIKRGQCTPIISNQLVMDFVFGPQDLTTEWADEVHYPMRDRRDLASIAQFVATTSSDEYLAKSAYLEFLKRTLIQEEKNKPELDFRFERIMDEIEDQDFAFSEVLRYLRPLPYEQHPLLMLASMDMPIFLTTSYHTIIEEALKIVRKNPISATFDWQHEELDDLRPKPNTELRLVLNRGFTLDEIRTLCYDLEIDYEDLPGESKERKITELVTFLERRRLLPELGRVGQRQRPDIPWDDLLRSVETVAALVSGPLSSERRDPAGKSRIQPDVDTPLVYHLFGIDTDPSTLVLTEDNFLDYLLMSSQDMFAIPPRVAQALAYSSLLLLGYEWQSWEFKILCQGLLRERRGRSSRLSLSTLNAPETMEANQDDGSGKEYVEKYLQRHNINVHWGGWQELLAELWRRYR